MGLEVDEVSKAGAIRRVPSPADAPANTLALRGETPDLIAAGLKMNKATMVTAFLAMTDAVDCTETDEWATVISALLDKGLEMEEVTMAAAL